MNTTAKTTANKTAPVVLDLGADLSPAVKAIESAYRMIQKAFPDAPQATIVVKRDEKAWGHTTVAKVWANAKAKGNAQSFEIMVSGENLRRGAIHVCATLLHEAAHARNLNKGILDTDTNGRHNTKFKATAEEHGLDCQCSGWHGWTLTSLTEEGQKRWARMIKLVETGLAKSAATAQPDLSHLGVKTPAAPAKGKGSNGTAIKPGGFVMPPKRGNHNLLKATCGCGHSIRLSRGCLEAAKPTCQECSEPFALV
jgi:hypothetical protein